MVELDRGSNGQNKLTLLGVVIDSLIVLYCGYL